MKTPPLLLSILLMATAAVPAHAVFDNTCLIFNIASRDNAMDDTWLSDSLFYLSTKTKRRSQIRNLTYVQEKDTDKTFHPTKQSEEKILDGDDVRFVSDEDKTTAE